MNRSTASALATLAALSLTLVPVGALAADGPEPSPIILGPEPGSLVHDVAEQQPSSPVSDGGSIVGPTSLGVGPGISVSEVADAPAGQVLLVNGSLLVDPDGEVRLWEALAESYPPQGAGAFLIIEGLDDETVEWTEAAGIRWSAGVQLLGRVLDGTLVIEPLAL